MSVTPNRTPLQLGDTLDGRYRIVSETAPGGLWRTFVAYDGQLSRLAQLVLPHAAADVALLERLARFNQAVAALGEPRLVPFDRLVQAGGRLYLVRRHLEGETLRQWLDRAGTLPPAAAVALAEQLCDALAPAHRAGLVHGGLTAHSIWVEAGAGVPRLSIVDAGIAPILELAQGAAQSTLAPEQVAGREPHAAADVYAIGLLLYEMLAGRPSLAANGKLPLTDKATMPLPVPLQLAQVVRTALESEPSARFRNAGQLGHLLRSLGSELESGQRIEAAVALPTVPPTQRMVVPAPSTSAPPPAAEPIYYPKFEQEQWADEPGGVDWWLVLLLAAATVAVLGLIPLWRELYRRYSPPPVPAPAGLVLSLDRPTVWQLADKMPFVYENGAARQQWARGWPVLENQGIIWYNWVTEAERERQLEKHATLHAHPAISRGVVPDHLSRRQPPGRKGSVRGSG